MGELVTVPPIEPLFVPKLQLRRTQAVIGVVAAVAVVGPKKVGRSRQTCAIRIRSAPHFTGATTFSGHDQQSQKSGQRHPRSPFTSCPRQLDYTIGRK